MLTTQEIDLRIRRIETLPPLPETVNKLCTLTQDMESDVREVSDLISVDETLTARILRVVNSAFYAFPHQIENVCRAVIVLGFSQVRSIALSLSLLHLGVLQSAADDDRRQLWRHAIATAVIARMLARSSGAADPDEVFTAGILHDLGKLVLRECQRDGYAQVRDTVAYACIDFCKVESQVFGLNHEQAGERLCLYWNLPEKLRKLVGTHHQPVSEQEFLTVHGRTQTLIQIADAFVKLLRIGDSFNDLIEHQVISAIRYSSLLRQEVHDLLCGIPREFEAVEQAFDLSLGIRLPEPTEKCVAVFLSDQTMRDAVVYILLSGGYRVYTADNPHSPSDGWTAVIYEGQLPSQLRERSIRDNAAMMEFPMLSPAMAGVYTLGVVLPRFWEWFDSAFLLARRNK